MNHFWTDFLKLNQFNNNKRGQVRELRQSGKAKESQNSKLIEQWVLDQPEFTKRKRRKIYEFGVQGLEIRASLEIGFGINLRIEIWQREIYQFGVLGFSFSVRASWNQIEIRAFNGWENWYFVCLQWLFVEQCSWSRY